MVFTGARNTIGDDSVGRPKTNRKITRISVSLDDRDYRALRKIAVANDVSAAWLVRRAIANLLEANTSGQNTPLKKVGNR